MFPNIDPQRDCTLQNVCLCIHVDCLNNKTYKQYTITIHFQTPRHVFQVPVSHLRSYYSALRGILPLPFQPDIISEMEIQAS